ncbi:MAG: response regulator [Polyangiaceae bacterium]
MAVPNGAKGIDVATTEPPDIVLLDLMLPGQYDGFEVCRRLRANPSTKNVPVVIVSALDDKEISGQGLRGAGDRVLHEAFQPHRSAQENRSPARSAQRRLIRRFPTETVVRGEQKCSPRFAFCSQRGPGSTRLFQQATTRRPVQQTTSPAG